MSKLTGFGEAIVTAARSTGWIQIALHGALASGIDQGVEECYRQMDALFAQPA